jgi:hypothetical protein
MISDEVKSMRISRSIFLNKVLPVIAMGMMVLTPLHAEEKTATKSEKSVAKNKSVNDVPPPAGPYRSMHGTDKSVQMQNRYEPPKWVQQQRAQMNQRHGRGMQAQQPPVQDARQWTPPTPPQWVQQQRQQSAQRPDWSKQQQVPAWVQEQRKQMAKPHQPPKWVQQQRQQSAQRPDWSKQQQVPAWVQEQRKQMAKPYQPPKWVEQQQKQMAKPYEPPKWVQQQREQMAKQQKEMGACQQVPQQAQQAANGNQKRFSAAPQYWAQNRMRMPPANGQFRRYGPPPVWARAPYPQYRRW